MEGRFSLAHSRESTVMGHEADGHVHWLSGQRDGSRLSQFSPFSAVRPTDHGQCDSHGGCPTCIALK